MQAGEASDLIVELRAPDTTLRRRQQILESIVASHQGLVHHFIKVRDAYDREDLAQVGNIGLLNAVERFDPTRKIAFSTFAGTQIRGEISHYLRDKHDLVHIPRPVQENAKIVSGAIETLGRHLGHSPTVAEINAHCGLDTSEILEALESTSVRSMRTLSDPENWDLPVRGDSDFESAETWATLHPALERLSPEDRRLLGMRFVEGLTQTQIAQQLGIHQVSVGRNIDRIRAQMRRDTGELSPDE